MIDLLWKNGGKEQAGSPELSCERDRSDDRDEVGMEVDRRNLHLDSEGRNSNIDLGFMEILAWNDGRFLWKNGGKSKPEARNSFGKRAGVVIGMWK